MGEGGKEKEWEREGEGDDEKERERMGDLGVRFTRTSECAPKTVFAGLFNPPRYRRLSD